MPTVIKVEHDDLTKFRRVRFKEAAKRAAESDDVIIDMSDAVEVDDVGVAAVLTVVVHAAKFRHSVSISGLSPSLAKLFQAAHVDEVCPIEPACREHLESLLTQNGGPLRICHTCDVPHYDNCAACFGFGVSVEKLANGSYAPVSGSRALSIAPDEWRACPICRSTPAGIPESS